MKSIPLILLLCCGAASADEYRTFTDVKGRKVEARLIEYDSAQERVFLERQTGSKSWINSDLLSDADQKYILEWHHEKQFLDPGIFVITVNEESSGWESTELLGVKEKTNYYQLTLINNSKHAIDHLRVDYCIYSYREAYGEKHITTSSFRQHLDRLNESETASIRTANLKIIKDSAMGDERGPLGVCFRIIKERTDSSTTMREIRSPKVRDKTKYPWKKYEDPASEEQMTTDGEASATMKPLLPEGAIPGQLTKEDVEKIAELYIKALEEGDYQLYYGLLAPLYQKKIQQQEERFKLTWVKSMDIICVEGLNVQIRTKLEGSGHKTDGWLQILPSGQIKYAPRSFEHPVTKAFVYANQLLNYTEYGERSEKIRKRAYHSLKGWGIPLFGYAHDAPQRDQQKSAEKILDWLIDNGDSWDASEPKVFLPEKAFKELVRQYK